MERFCVLIIQLTFATPRRTRTSSVLQSQSVPICSFAEGNTYAEMLIASNHLAAHITGQCATVGASHLVALHSPFLASAKETAAMEVPTPISLTKARWIRDQHKAEKKMWIHIPFWHFGQFLIKALAR